MKKPSSKKSLSPETLANHEVVVLAAYHVGADTGSADTEDIAIKANELAPGRFSWRKYKDQVSIDAVRKRLWDATKPEKGGYLIGSEKTGWRLTKAGFDFARGQVKAGNSTQPLRAPASQAERAAQNRELKRLLNEDAFLKIQSGQVVAVTKLDAEKFFRIDDYITGKGRKAKIERFRIIAAQHGDLASAIEILAPLIQES